MVIQASFFHIFTVVLVSLTLLIIIEISIPVGIKIQKLSTFFQNPKPLFISHFRMGQIPGQVSGNDHVKALIFKLQCLGIHSFKFNIPALFSDKFRCIFCSLFQHSRSVIYGCYMISCFRKNHREKAWTCADIQNSQVVLIFVCMLFFGKFFFENFFFHRIVF